MAGRADASRSVLRDAVDDGQKLRRVREQVAPKSSGSHFSTVRLWANSVRFLRRRRKLPADASKSKINTAEENAKMSELLFFLLLEAVRRN